MTLREQLELTEAQMVLLTKVARGDTKLLFKAKKSLDRTMEIVRDDWTKEKKRKYIKEYLRVASKIQTPIYSKRGVETIEGRRFEELKLENDQLIASIKKKHGTSQYDCALCGLTDFHSQLAHWWRNLKKGA